MGYFDAQIITNEGVKMLAKAEAGVTTVTFTTVKTGNGIYSVKDFVNLDHATQLKQQKQEFDISDFVVKDDTIILRSTLCNKDLKEGYLIQEIGIFAKEDDGEEKMIAISVCQENPTYMPEFDTTQIEMPFSDFIAHSGGNGKFNINYESQAYVNVEEFQSMKEYFSSRIKKLEDDKLNKEDHIDWGQLDNKPENYPPDEHKHNRTEVGLGNVDNTSDANKPVSTAQATAIADAKKAGTDAQSNLDTHTSNKSNPHGVTKSQVGLGNVPNVATNDQTPTYTVSSSNTSLSSGEKLSVAFGKIAKAVSSLISHLANTSNPHSVTKSQVGLGNVDNTSDANKPVSTAQATAIADAKKAGTDAQSNLNTHTSNKSNPHGVTKSQVGLGNVDNTSDTNKPVSTAQQDAIDLAYANSNAYTDKKISDLIGGAPTTLDTLKEIADAMSEHEEVVDALNKAIGTKANESEFTSHTGNKSNPHGVTKSQVGLGNVPNVATNDQTPTYTVASSNTALSSGEKLSVAFGKIAKAVSSLISHLANTSNPHSVTKSQVGLGNVGNFKAVSTVASQGLSDTEKSNARTNIGASASGHTHNYAGASSAGGSATSAVKLDSSAGSATQPVYFSGGKPVACTYTLGKSVPSNAVFTDTNTWRGIQDNLTSTSTTDSLSAKQGKVLNDKFGTTLTSTLSAGSTTITFSNSVITTSSTIDLYTDVYGVNPTAVSVEAGKMTLTFDAQTTDISVKAVIK